MTLVSSGQVPSIGVVEEALKRQEESYRHRAGTVDTKAGVVLGAAGVLVALVGAKPSVAGFVGQVLALAAGTCCILCLRPRHGRKLGPSQLRDEFIQADPLVSQFRC